MSSDPNAPAPEPGDAPLQFDRAEMPAAVTCVSCKTPIAGEFYQVNGQTICSNCRSRFSAFAAAPSNPANFALAFGAGLGAGFGGFLLYYVVLFLTHINFGLIAIVVGWMVGAAVRWGSRGFGGRAYQALAAAIAYVAICANYLPAILRMGAAIAKEHGRSIGLDFYPRTFLMSLTAPWIGGVDIIGWLILGFGVYQAWQMNRPIKLAVAGPFFTRQTPPPAAS
jgi:hypothetical protein